MRLLLDSADIKDVRRFFPGNVLAGVTTNPSLIAKQGKRDYLELLAEIYEELDTGSDPQHFSVEVTTLDPLAMVEQAEQLSARLGKKVHVKVPVMPETLSVIEMLAARDIKVNATACATALQAKLATDAGADIVSFFYNRMIDHNFDNIVGVQTERDRRIEARRRALLEVSNYVVGCGEATVICGSIRLPQDVWECWEAGAYLVTAPAKVIDDALRHPKTVEAINQFQKDIDAWQG